MGAGNHVFLTFFKKIPHGTADDVSNALQRLNGRISRYRLRKRAPRDSLAVDPFPFIRDTLQSVSALFYDLYYFHIKKILVIPDNEVNKKSR